jgi:urea transport system permease protein
MNYLPKSLLRLCLGFLLFGLALPALAQQQADFESALQLLQEKSYDTKSEAVRKIVASGHPEAHAVLAAMLEGDLFTRKKERDLVIAVKEGRKLRITGVLSGEDLGLVKKRSLKKVSVNNQLRGQIRSALALLNLDNPDAGERLAAVGDMLDSIDAESAALLRDALAKERDADVREAMELGIALGEVVSNDPAIRLQAIEVLDGNLHPSAFNRLTTLVEQEEDEDVRRAARAALNSIDLKRQFSSIAETLFFGLSLGSVLVLAAIGLAITFGVMGVINMAHGELIMLGAYTTYLLQVVMPEYPGIALLLSIPVAFLVSGGVGVLIERGVIRFLYGRPLETLLATFGISLILQQLVRVVISPQNVPVSNPSWMSGSIEINSVLSLTWNRLYIIVFSLMVFAALFMILKKTALGLQVRAVAQNRAMARAMGVRSERVDALTFGLGSGIAGIAGVALSQLTNVGPNLGQSYIIDSFMVVVFGGVGNLWGTLVAGMTLGVANKIMEPWAGAVLAKILVLVFIILFIQKRPRGLFPQKGRAAEG